MLWVEGQDEKLQHSDMKKNCEQGGKGTRKVFPGGMSCFIFFQRLNVLSTLDYLDMLI